MKSFFFSFLLLTTCAPGPSVQAGAFIDLHAHVSMKPGMGPLFQDGRGGKSPWDSRWSEKLSLSSLERAPVGIVVAALYAHPILTGGGVRSAIERELQEIRTWVNTTSQLQEPWVIARTAREARAAQTAGKRVLILSLETAWGIEEDADRFAEWAHGQGIAIVTPFHLTDDPLGGAAFLASYRVLGNPLAWLQSLWLDTQDAWGNRINPLGVTPKGLQFLHALTKRGIWIDLAHLPDRAWKEVNQVLVKSSQPLLVTHTSLRQYLPAERAVPDFILVEMEARGGILGLIPSDEMMGEARGSNERCVSTCDLKKCLGGVFDFARHYRAAVATLGQAQSVSLGSDLNSPLHTLPPSCGTGTSLDGTGFVGLEQVEDLWTAVAGSRQEAQALGRAQTERFLQLWAKVSPSQ